MTDRIQQIPAQDELISLRKRVAELEMALGDREALESVSAAFS